MNCSFSELVAHVRTDSEKNIHPIDEKNALWKCQVIFMTEAFLLLLRDLYTGEIIIVSFNWVLPLNTINF